MRRLSRRLFLGRLSAAGLALLAGCRGLPPETQPAKVRHIGYLAVGTRGGARGGTFLATLEQLSLNAFQDSLRRLGYVDGENVRLETRVADLGQEARLAELAGDLASLKVDVIVASGTAPAVAAGQVSGGVPVVFVNVGAPVGLALVTSLARPGGNVTGLVSLSPELAAKRLELLKEAAPTISRAAVLWNSGDAADALELAGLQAAAPKLGVQIRPLEVRTQLDLFPALEVMARERADALMPITDNISVNVIATTALRAGVPTMGHQSELVTNGGLMAYGPNVPDLYRRAAVYVDKILRGAKPADLPVEQPDSFSLTVNLKTAQALGLTIPQSILAQATELIQ